MSDESARKSALDTSRSFIVQAPAGSGKTELLIQRYLALLATVELPEQVIAITFTRKAAAEMRGRVLAALNGAAQNQLPAETHRIKTHELALRVLARDQAQGWELLTQPQRLRINTLDALNAWLAQQLPMLSGGVAGARILEDSRDFYGLAARRLLEQLAEDSPLGRALKRLLEHSNAGIERLEVLLAGLLPTRDQWLHYLTGSDDEHLRRALEAARERLIADELAALADALPGSAAGEVVAMLQHAAVHAVNPGARAAFQPWLTLDRLPPPTAAGAGSLAGPSGALVDEDGYVAQATGGHRFCCQRR